MARKRRLKPRPATYGLGIKKNILRAIDNALMSPRDNRPSLQPGYKAGYLDGLRDVLQTLTGGPRKWPNIWPTKR